LIRPVSKMKPHRKADVLTGGKFSARNYTGGIRQRRAAAAAARADFAARQVDLFAVYPDSPAARPTDTSEAAADSVAEQVRALRAKCLRALRAAGAVELNADMAPIGGLTADECAARLDISILSIRPRFSELKKLGLIRDSRYRRLN
jgi:hypothetical protein